MQLCGASFVIEWGGICQWGIGSLHWLSTCAVHSLNKVGGFAIAALRAAEECSSGIVHAKWAGWVVAGRIRPRKVVAHGVLVLAHGVGVLVRAVQRHLRC